MNHAFQHLGRGDHLAAGHGGGLDHALLDDRDLLKGDLDAHVAARDHHGVRSLDDFVNMRHAVRVFDLCDDAHVRAAVFIKQLAQSLHILSPPDKGGRDIIKTGADAKQHIVLVFLADIGHGKAHAGYVDTFAVADLPP